MTVIITTSSLATVTFEHVAANGNTVLRSHAFIVNGSFSTTLNHGIDAGESVRLVINTTLVLGGKAQGTLSIVGI